MGRTPAAFPLPDPARDLGNHLSGELLRDRIGERARTLVETLANGDADARARDVVRSLKANRTWRLLFLEFVIDPACAFVFEADPEAQDIMKRKPRRPDESLFSASMLKRSVALGLLALSAVSYPSQPDSRPNILLIVADDLGYADVGAYGSDIRTPNIDALAAEGMLFTQFHTSPLCAPTRAMLLSGNNNHVAGVGRMHAAGPIQVHVPGYETHLPNRIAPLPRLLKDAGYHTYTTGQRHLGNEKEHSPTAASSQRPF